MTQKQKTTITQALTDTLNAYKIDLRDLTKEIGTPAWSAEKHNAYHTILGIVDGLEIAIETVAEC